MWQSIAIMYNLHYHWIGSSEINKKSFTHLFNFRRNTNVFWALLGRMKFVSSSCFCQGCQRRLQRAYGGRGIWPLEIKESILEAVGWNLIWGNCFAGLNQTASAQIRQHLCQCGSLQLLLRLLRIYGNNLSTFKKRLYRILKEDRSVFISYF